MKGFAFTVFRIALLHGYIDRAGHLVVFHQFDQPRAFYYGMAAVSGVRGSGLILPTGRYLAGPYFERTLQSGKPGALQSGGMRHHLDPTTDEQAEIYS